MVRLSRAGKVTGVYGKTGASDRYGEFRCPASVALAAMTNGGFVVQERDGGRFQVFGSPRM